jgi:hypothetical protein
MQKLLNEFIPVGGVLPDPEHNAGKNWIFGGVDDVWEIIEDSGDWGKFSSPPEKQASKYSDPYWCVSISLAGDIEKHLNKMMLEDPSTRPLFDSLGLLHKDGYADISERFIAKGSGTIPGRGNSQYAVYEFVRKNGFVGEKSWPASPEMTEDEQYAELTPEVRALGKKVLECIGFNYKDVLEDPDHRREGLKRSGLCTVVGGAVLGNEQGATLYRNNGTPSYNHQLQIYKQDRDVRIFSETIPVIDRVEDSYDPFLKDYSGTYPFKFCKIIKLTIKKKLPMFRLAKTASSPAVYILCEGSMTRLGVADSEVEGLTGGTLLKLFCGNYGNAGISIISDEEMNKYAHAGNIQANLFN